MSDYDSTAHRWSGDDASDTADDLPHKLVERARSLMRLGRAQAAVPLLERALSVGGEDAHTLALLAACFSDLGDLPRCIAYAERAARADPQYDYPWRLVSYARRRGGEWDEALRAAEEAVRLAPELSDAHRILAHARRAAGLYDLASESADRVIELAPDDATSYITRGRVRADRGEWAEAVADFRHALRLDPESSEAHEDLFRAYRQLGNRADSLRHLFAALRSDPRRDDLSRDLVPELAPYAPSAARHALKLIAFFAVLASALFYGVGWATCISFATFWAAFITYDRTRERCLRRASEALRDAEDPARVRLGAHGVVNTIADDVAFGACCAFLLLMPLASVLYLARRFGYGFLAIVVLLALVSPPLRRWTFAPFKKSRRATSGFVRPEPETRE